MEIIIAIGLIATVIFLVRNNTGEPGESKRRSKQLNVNKNAEPDPWASKPTEPRSLRNLLPKGFLEQSGDKILDFTKPLEKESINDYSKVYALEKSILTPAELKYMKVLQEVVGGNYYILSKVRIADVFKVKKQIFGEAEYKWFNKIKAKHFDYVLCCPKTFRPIILMELDDASHSRPDRIKRDEFINKICTDVGIRIIRQTLMKEYDLNKIKQSIFKE